MSDFSVLKKLAEDANKQFPALEDQWSMVCTPTVGLDLIAEIERLGLKADSLEFAKWSCQVNQEAIRAAGHETIDDLAAERDQLKTELESSRKLASEYARCADNEYAEVHKLKADNEALKSQNEVLRRIPTCWDEVYKQSEELDALREQQLQLVTDAERYRFIVDCPIRTLVVLSRMANGDDFDLGSECDRLSAQAKAREGV